jgi:hypothetical protein
VFFRAEGLLVEGLAADWGGAKDEVLAGLTDDCSSKSRISLSARESLAVKRPFFDRVNSLWRLGSIFDFFFQLLDFLYH